MTSPVRGYSTPNRVRFALRPVIGTAAWEPRKAQHARNGGNNRIIVSSSYSSTSPGRQNCFKHRTIAPFLNSMRIFGHVDIAGALPTQSDFFHPAPERPRSDLSVVTLAQMGRQQGHCPNGRVVTEFQRIAREFP